MRVFVGTLSLATVAWAAGTFTPERSEAAVASILSGGASGEVATSDWVWGPSGGVLSDLFVGRPVAFLARAEGDGERDAWYGRVSCTPGGRPLRGRAFRRLTRTAYGDEARLEGGPRYFAYGTSFRGHFQSLGIVDWRDGEGSARLGLRRSPGELAIQWSEDDLVVDADGVAASVHMPGVEVRAEVGAEIDRGEVGSESGPPIVPGTIEAAVGLAPLELSLEDFHGVVPSVFSGGPPAVLESRGDGARTLVFDGRQVELDLVPGRRSPHSDTGRVATGQPPDALAERPVVAIVSLPAVRGASGYFDGVAPFGPIGAGAATIGVEAGRVRVGAWPHDDWTSGSFGGVLRLDGVESASRTALCATAGGHLAIGWGEEREPALPGDCVSTVRVGGGAGDVWIGEDALARWRAGTGFEVTSLIVYRAGERGVPVSPGAGPSASSPLEWQPVADAQSEPAWLASSLTARTSVLGTDVDLVSVDVGRFDWAIVAGERERAHRFKGTFPVRVEPADSARVRLALGLANGKRRGPRGLRIQGSTGLGFRGKEGLLTVRSGGLAILPAGRTPAEPEEDGTELPLAADAGTLMSAARERGPRQLRADICLLDEAHLLVAESIFDSHEASATALLGVGCTRVLALDRGTEHPAWRLTGPAAAGPFETTALVALSRPLVGHAAPFEP